MKSRASRMDRRQALHAFAAAAAAIGTGVGCTRARNGASRADLDASAGGSPKHASSAARATGPSSTTSGSSARAGPDAPATSSAAATASGTTPQPSSALPVLPKRSPAKAPAWLARIGEAGSPALEPIADLVLVSGQLVACDPLVFLTNTEPFIDALPGGRYPVLLGRLEPRLSAFAMVKLAEKRARSWELAIGRGDAPDKIARGASIGYPVDAGTGAFVDRAMATRLDAEDAKRGGDLLPRLRAAGYGTKAKERDWASLIVDAATGANLVVFRSGEGDGVYSSYWGLDEGRRPVALVTDFGLLTP